MKKVDWSKWSAVAEILSAVAIVVTLGYLAVQTRYLAVQTDQNTAALLANNRQVFLATELDWLYRSREWPAETAEIYGVPLLEDPTRKYDSDAWQAFLVSSLALFRARETQWLNYMNGAADQEQWTRYRDVLLRQIRVSENVRAAWDVYSENFVPSFREEIESRLRD